MRFSADFRYLVPPFTSLCLMLFLSQSNLWPQEYAKLEFYLLIYHPRFLLVLAIAMLVFLFTSVKLPVTLTQEPLRLRVGDFSVPLALSMLSSLIFPPPFFWLVFPVLVLVPASLFRVVLDVLKRFIYWLYQTLQDIPGLSILCTIQHQEEPEQVLPDPQVEIHELVEIEVIDIRV